MKNSLTNVVSRVFFALGSALFIPQITLAETLAIDTAHALAQALRHAPEGSELVLAPGDYGTLAIHGDTGVAVIRSREPDAPARFDRAEVTGVDGLRLDGLLFDYVFRPGDVVHGRHFSFQNVSDLAITNSVFDGDQAWGVSAVDNGYGYGMALAIREGDNIQITGNRVFNFWKGMNIFGVEALTVQGNDLYGLRSDGMNFIQVSDVLIEGNHIHDFNRSVDSEDHADMIQFWTSRSDWSSHDVVIRGNLLDAGSGWFTQSIFMANDRSARQGSTDLSIFFRDILIEDNVIINAHTHGITVGDTIGLTIRNNTVVQVPSAATGDPQTRLHIPAIRVAEINQDVVLDSNIVGRIIGYGGQSNWQVRNNLIVQNQSPATSGHYSQVFLGGSETDPGRFRYHPDGPAATAPIGAEMLRSGQSPVDLLP